MMLISTTDLAVTGHRLCWWRVQEGVQDFSSSFLPCNRSVACFQADRGVEASRSRPWWHWCAEDKLPKDASLTLCCLGSSPIVWDHMNQLISLLWHRFTMGGGPQPGSQIQFELTLSLCGFSLSLARLYIALNQIALSGYEDGKLLISLHGQIE